jgi:proteasome lid subunit RPN8/RPN11
MSDRVGRVTELIGLRQVSVDHVYPHVFENADREVGGVLVGRSPRDGGPPLVTGAIPALAADERRATLTFTQDAWEHVHRTLDAEFPPDEQIVGWYHSHPGFGIFLSEHDLFIHRNFFSGASQVALVVDPHARSEGVFTWADGEIALLFERPTPDGWHAPPPAWPAPERQPAASPRRAGTRYPPLALVLAALLGLALGFGAEQALVGADDAARTVTQTVTTHPAAPGPAPQTTTSETPVETP